VQSRRSSRALALILAMELMSAPERRPAIIDIVPEENNMDQTVESKNKNLVLEAFDMLFNKRDYVAAEKFWSPNYIQHSAHIPPGREGLFNLVKSIPPSARYESREIVAENDLVIVHGRYSGLRRASQLDYGGHRSYEGWRSSGALGCDPGRSNV
jgi:hypothetical protein